MVSNGLENRHNRVGEFHLHGQRWQKQVPSNVGVYLPKYPASSQNTLTLIPPWESQLSRSDRKSDFKFQPHWMGRHNYSDVENNVHKCVVLLTTYCLHQQLLVLITFVNHFQHLNNWSILFLFHYVPTFIFILVQIFCLHTTQSSAFSSLHFLPHYITNLPLSYHQHHPPDNSTYLHVL